MRPRYRDDGLVRGAGGVDINDWVRVRNRAGVVVGGVSGKVVEYVFEEPVQFAVALELQLVKTEVYRFAIK